MFTGIVQTKAQVNAVVDREQFRQLELAVPAHYLAALETGASIAINGCCLTVTEFNSHTEPGTVSFDIIDETLRLTNLGSLSIGEEVNFERSLTMGTELGGHIVSGHIQTTAAIAERHDSSDNCRLYLELEPRWLEYILPKGFITVNGASLTVGDVTEQGFWLHLIPETLERTNLGEAIVGTRLNIEVDTQTFTIVETVKKVLARTGTAS
ncbi:riboflavin synthase subunit alpha [Aliidiomarina quisquiliarum]|uniref:riboflavin synthase subunit alpha n=1 Tax=Aliidiomarina quisquiliarum TaxID=2938947 RepID=UPI00208E3963|nr:riboflavin synthase subunit alpha [Aliidiomarina quisquiliarum]MCO4320900.1 riboflavin synthase subunit alpha [Aliidiomarina quisquiliarum]